MARNCPRHCVNVPLTGRRAPHEVAHCQTSRVDWFGLICTSTGLLVTFYNYWIQNDIMGLNERHLCVTSHPSGLLCYLSPRCRRFGRNMDGAVVAINSYN